MTSACANAAKFFPALKTPMLQAGALNGKTALITGGGSGLGKAMAEMFSSLGANVAIASRRLDLLQTVAADIHKQTGNKVLAIQLNVKDADQVKLAIDQCENELGLPNIVVNNAAGNFIQATERLSANAMSSVTDIVLKGTFNVTLEVAKRLIKQQKGCAFLSISTSYARTGSPFVVPSACAKAGVEIMCKSLAAEWGKYGLRFNCIAPGPIYTEGAFSRLDPTGAGLEATKNHIPAGRVGETQELANLASFVCSDFASWMNGSIIDFDGGETVLNAGEFSKLHSVTGDQWTQLESMIRQSTGKAKL